MKKIILSLSMLLAVGAVVAASTGAFFSDTETSTANVFTAGAIDLTVDSEQHYNGSVCTLGDWDNNSGTADTYAWQGPAVEYPAEGTPCDGTWLPTDLGAQKFFNFDDLKPGDTGENTLSFHVTSNDAYLKAGVGAINNLDNSCTEPEEEDSNDLCTVASPEGSTAGMGELGSAMMFRVWVDSGATLGWQGSGVDSSEGDNIYQSATETLVANWMTLSDLKTALAASNMYWEMTPANPFYLGMEWSLDDSTDNEAQTDSLEFPLVFEVQQTRNNPAPSFGI